MFVFLSTRPLTACNVEIWGNSPQQIRSHILSGFKSFFSLTIQTCFAVSILCSY